MSVTPQICLMRSTFLQSLAPTLIKLTHLWFSNDPEDMLRCVWLRLELDSAGKCILWARFEDSWPIWNNRFWKGLFWFEPFQFNWVAKEWPVNVVFIPLVALQGCLHKTCVGPKDTKVALGRMGWPTMGLMWAAHIPPFHQQEPDASSEPVLLPVLSWFDWRAL